MTSNHIPSSDEVYRRVAERLDAETLFQLDCYLALLARNIHRGRLDVAMATVERLRAALGTTDRRSHEVIS